MGNSDRVRVDDKLMNLLQKSCMWREILET